MSETTEAPTMEAPMTAPQPGAEVATRPRVQASLPAKIAYARELANSGLLPSAYRHNPGNVLYAVEYGDMLGLSPMAAITGVHIIEGKPSASAGLISALVRRAGHKLRVKGDARSATCQIIRCDDPDYVFEVTWTLKRNSDGNPSAEDAKLLGKEVWQKYAASMLKSRAITQCARDACEEALFGLHYTPEELGVEVDEDGNVIQGEVVHDDAPDPNREWADEALKHAQTFADEQAGNKLWAEIVKRKDDRKLPVMVAERLKDAVRARWAELAAEAKEAEAGPVDAEVVEGEIVPELDPEDPWALRVEEIASAEDAGAVSSEVGKAISDGTLDDNKGAAVFAAIAVRESALSQQAAA